MRKVVPASWLPIHFEEVFTQISTSGKKVKTAEALAEGKFPVVDQGRAFVSGYLDDAGLVVTDEKPLIIFGDHTREIKWIDFAFIPGADGVKILKPHSEMNGRFLYFFLRNLPIESKGYARHFKILKDAEYRVPPLAEQTRIAQKLDELLAQVDTLKARIDAIPTLLKRFRQSILAAAVSGRLTEEWRNANEASQHQSLLRTLSHLKKFKSEQIKLKNIKSDLAFGESPTNGEYLGTTPDAWEKLRIRDISIKITDGEHATPKRQDHGHYLISARNIGNSEILLSDVDYVGDDEYQRIRKRCDPSIGDVLISCSGSVGRVSLVDKNDAYVMVRSVALVRPAPEAANIKYLMYFLQSPFAQVQIATRSKSTAQANLFLGEIKEIEFASPSLEEQTEIVHRVEQLFAFADQLEAKVASAKSRIDHLTQSILAKAFRGELLPQDPNDEPASMLLERIQAQRAAAPKAKRGRKASA